MASDDDFTPWWSRLCEEWSAIRDERIAAGKAPSAHEVTTEHYRRMNGRGESVFAMRRRLDEAIRGVRMHPSWLNNLATYLESYIARCDAGGRSHDGAREAAENALTHVLLILSGPVDVSHERLVELLLELLRQGDKPTLIYTPSRPIYTQGYYWARFGGDAPFVIHCDGERWQTFGSEDDYASFPSGLVILGGPLERP